MAGAGPRPGDLLGADPAAVAAEHRRTANTITSAGNVKRAKADRDGSDVREREDSFTGQSCPDPLTID
jgi:hypothetical protein